MEISKATYGFKYATILRVSLFIYILDSTIFLFFFHMKIKDKGMIFIMNLFYFYFNLKENVSSSRDLFSSKSQVASVVKMTSKIPIRID